MNILNKISIRNLKLNKKRTISTIIGIILSTALICAVATMATSFQHTLVQNDINKSGYYHLKLYNVTDENIKKICEEINALDLDEIYLMAGNGRVPVNTIINIIDKSDEVVTPKNIKITSSNTDADIIVTGIDKVKVNLANCSNPVYGDEIIGYITKGNGISVHRINCHNLEMLEDRTLEVVWGSNSNKRYYTSLVVYTNTGDNHMLDLMQSISMLNISVDEIKTISRVDNVLYEVGCYVTGLEQLNKAIMTLTKANYIDRVERVMR